MFLANGIRRPRPFPVKPPHLGRINFKPEDMVTAEDTTPQHAKACKELYERSGGFYNAGAFTPFLYHEEGAPPKSSLIFPGATGGTNWGGVASDPKEGYVFAYTQNVAQIGWTEKKKPGVEYGSEGGGPDLLYARASVDGPARSTPSAPRPPTLMARPSEPGPVRNRHGVSFTRWMSRLETSRGKYRWALPRSCRKPKQHTGRSVSAFAGPTATAGDLIFIGAVPDNRFRALDSKTGKELLSVKLDAAANANPMTYQGKSGKQYVAIVSGGAIHAFALP